MTEEERFGSVELAECTVGIRDNHAQRQYYHTTDYIDLLNEQERRIQTLQRSVERREEQISIIKKYCLQFLTLDEIRTIEEALRKDDLKKGD